MKCLIENYDEINAELAVLREKTTAEFKATLEKMGFAETSDGIYTREDMAEEVKGHKHELRFDINHLTPACHVLRDDGHRRHIECFLGDETVEQFIDVMCFIFQTVMAHAKKGKITNA